MENDFDQDYDDQWEDVTPLIDGGRKRLKGPFPFQPHEEHDHFNQGHWSRDGKFLIIACCGLDGT